MADDDGVRVVASFAEIAGYDVVAVDMPIGLPVSGQRACDVAARRIAGVRRASVFAAPLQCVLEAPDHPTAVRLARAAGGPAPSIQAWNLVPRIREVAEAWREGVVEAHPEVCFAVMAGAPMAFPKRSAAGRAERLAALGLTSTPRLPGAAPDDVLDALACRWTAHRVARGDAVALGHPPTLVLA